MFLRPDFFPENPDSEDYIEREAHTFRVERIGQILRFYYQYESELVFLDRFPWETCDLSRFRNGEFYSEKQGKWFEVAIDSPLDESVDRYTDPDWMTRRNVFDMTDRLSDQRFERPDRRYDRPDRV